MMAARNALLGVAKGKDSVTHWSVEDVSIWLEAHEIFTLRETFKTSAVHGGFLMCLTSRDLECMVESPLLRTKVTLLIQQLALGVNTRDKEPVPVCWTVAQVGDWLDCVGLSLYKDIFEKHSIDGLMLSNLDEAMLDHLGVTNKLHRRSAALGLLQLLAAKKNITPRKMSPRDRVSMWQADKVAQWLSTNDFDDRKLQFRNNGIHGAMLVGLTDADMLNFLDMTNSIERARLLRDIRHLCDEPIDVVPGSASGGASQQRRGMVERAAAASAVNTPNKVAPKRSSDVLKAKDENDDSDDSDDDDDSDETSHSDDDDADADADDNNDSDSADDSDEASTDSIETVEARVSSTSSDNLPHIVLTKKVATIVTTDSPPKRQRVEVVNGYMAPTLPKPPAQNPPPPSTPLDCRMCRARKVDCELGPCGHRTICSRCAELLDDCPTCKRAIDELSPF